MSRKYNNNFKSMFVNLIINKNHSTIKKCRKWITAYNKDHNVFNSDYLSHTKQIELLKKKMLLKKNNEILKKRFLY